MDSHFFTKSGFGSYKVKDICFVLFEVISNIRNIMILFKRRRFQHQKCISVKYYHIPFR